jgi:uncharacterized membrane protein SirB2
MQAGSSGSSIRRIHVRLKGVDYPLIKHLHIGLALVSIAGFMLRWFWRMQQSPLALALAARTLPHVVDTLLLGSALVMIALTGTVPVSTDWLSAKVGGLILYIVLGVIAMRSAPVKSRSVPAFIGAVLVFSWIVSVAVSKSPWGFLP